MPQAGKPPSIATMDPTRQIPAARAPQYLDYERQIEASKRMSALEAGDEPKTMFLEPEDGDSTETALAETGGAPTAMTEIHPKVDQFTAPRSLVKEYGYSKEAELEYYNMPNTKVLEFHTEETVGRPLVETPDPVFVPDEHWIWEDPFEAQQDAHIHEETVMDSLVPSTLLYIYIVHIAHSRKIPGRFLNAVHRLVVCPPFVYRGIALTSLHCVDVQGWRGRVNTI